MNNGKLSVYLVGPISGLDYDNVTDRYKRLTTQLYAMGFDVLCPLSGKQYLRNEVRFKAHGYDKHPGSTNRAIIGRDRWMVERADILLCDLTAAGDRVSIGSCYEMAWGYDTNKLVIGVMQPDNIHRHAFVLESCDLIFENMDDAIHHLSDFSKGALDL